MSDTAIGIVLLTVAGIAYGGSFLLRVVSGRFAANDLQKTYFRAGHAHAGVLVILGLLVAVILRDADVPAWSARLSGGVRVERRRFTPVLSARPSTSPISWASEL